MKKTLLQALFFLLGGVAVAQQTGSFNTQLTFMGQTRNLSCYVPTTYNAANAYKLMVCLHGLGDNSTNYRNALINSLGWQNNFPNTIFICPDGGSDQNKDFYTPAGDEAIIAEAMEYAMQNYHIDTNYVVLQGFSLGGRSAAKYGFDNPALFKGLLLNTPAFQGWKDAHNIPPYSLGFNYANASQIPVYITVGDADLYYNILETLVPELKAQDAIVNYNSVPGMGHNIPGASITAPAYPFFDNPGSQAIDLDLFEIEIPQRTCAANISPICFVQNKSDSVITSIEVNYQFGSASGTETWTGNLNPYEHAEIALSGLSTSAGRLSLEVALGTINGMYTDTIAIDNTSRDTIQVEYQGAGLPVTEGFESNSSGWVFNETGTLFEWYQDTDVKKSGQASMASFNTALLFNTQGNVESFESPLLDLTTVTDPELSFDVAFNYHEYTAQVAGIDTSFADTLEITVSTNCGETWQSVYKKGGADLATATTPILNPLNLNQIFYQPGINGWRRDSIDLQSFGSSTDAIIRFNYISAMGGSIYIDNILIGDHTVSLKEEANSAFNIYPNPAKNLLTVEWLNDSYDLVSVYNTTGKKVLETITNNGSQGLVLDISNLNKGVYFISLTGQSETITERFVKVE